MEDLKDGDHLESGTVVADNDGGGGQEHKETTALSNEKKQKCASQADNRDLQEIFCGVAKLLGPNNTTAYHSAEMH